MSSTKLGAILALFIAGQSLGATSVVYTLEVGGDNHASTLTNGPCDNNLPMFTSGNTANGTTQTCIVTWAVRASLTGTYDDDANGGTPEVAPLGIANVVFNLELRDGADQVVATFGKGSDSSQGFFSTVNDAAGSNCFGPKTEEAASFPVSFDVHGDWNGRLIDAYVTGGNNTGGPGLTYFQYPSALSFPPTSTCPGGTLCGAGAGYPSYTPNGCPDDCDFPGPGGYAVPGLGYYLPGNPMPSCIAFATSQGLGDVAIVEGQLNMTGLIDGTYKLVLTPGTGTNLIKSLVDCEADPGSFAIAASSTGTVTGDDITFNIAGCVGQQCLPGDRTVVGRHIFYNNSFYDTPGTACNNTFNGGQPCNDNSAVAPNVIALLPGQPVIVPPAGDQGVNSNYSSYSKGINGIMIDVQYGAGCSALTAGALSAPQIASTLEFVETVAGNSGRAVTSAYTGAVRVPTSVTIAPHPTLASTDRMTIIFADDTSTNSHWLRTRVLPGGVVDSLAGEDKFYFGLAKAEGMSVTGTNALVSSTDLNGPKPPNNHTSINRAPINDSYDYNRDSLVGSADQNLTKPPNNTTSINCLQLTGVAP
jgi:hypothetical protein